MAKYRIVHNKDEKLPGDDIAKYIARDNPEHEEHDKVNYKSNLTNMSADRIFIDFISKNTKIEMNDENNNILVQSKIKNVGN